MSYKEMTKEELQEIRKEVAAKYDDRLSGTASSAGPFRLSARNALPQGRA